MEQEAERVVTPDAPEAELVPTQDEKTMAMLAHGLGIVAGFLGPLIIWLIKKDQSKFVDVEAKEALNFQLTLVIGYLVSGILMFVCIGYFTAMAVWFAGIVFSIMGAMAANSGKSYRYPVTIRMIK